jgi:hypothetical protein
MDVVGEMIFKRVDGAKYTMIKDDVKMFNIFFAIDGRRSVKAIAQEDGYEMDYLFPIIHKMEKMGLLVPLDGTGSINELQAQAEEIFVTLPKEYRTGIKAVDQQHQRLVDMVNQLDDVRKALYQTR